MSYRVHLLDRQRNLLAVLPAEGGSYSRKPSEATDVRVTIPRSDELAASPDLAQYPEVWDATRRLVSGIITDRALGETTISLSAKTEEILLERHHTPAQYGPALSGLDLADFARALLYDYHTVRVKAREQWDAAIERVNVDTATMPGLVLLAKDANGAYLPDGYITLRFRRSDIPGFVAWDRIRWLSDHKPPVSTSIQYRYGPDPANLTAWSSPVSGGLPDTVGLVPGTVDAEILDVRVNLHTDDTTSQDPNGKPVGYSPRVYAVEVIARCAGQVAGDFLPATTGVTVRGIDADNANALELLRTACEQADWEFWVDGGQLYLAKQRGTDRTNQFVLREGTNCAIDTLSEDDSDLVNVLDAYGPGDGLNRMHVHLRAEDSIVLYGPRHGSEEFADAVDLADLTAKAQAYLDAHKWPVASFEAQALFSWGEEPVFEVGDTVKVVSPRSSAVATVRIMEESRSWGSGGVQVQLRLGRPRPSFVRAVLEATGQDEPPSADELPAPLGFRVESAQPGVRVWVNPFPPGSRAVGVEIHAGITSGFAPSTATLVRKGPETQWHIAEIPAGQRWWFVARSYDAQGNYSPLTEYLSAVAGYIPGATLDPSVQSDIAYAKTQAAVVEANAAVWDMARFIDDTTLVAAAVTAATANTIADSSKDWAALGVSPNFLVRILSGAGKGQVRAITAVSGSTLTIDPPWDTVPAVGDQFEVSSSARITSRETGSIVAKLNQDAAVSEFSSIRQNYNQIQSLVAAFESVTVVEGSATSATTTTLTDTSKDFLAAGVRKGYHVEITSGPLAKQLRVITGVTANQITVDAPWPSAPAAGTSYKISSPSKSTASAITQRADEISSIVTRLESDLSDPTQFSAIRQAASEIDLRVRKDSVISAINLSPEQIKLQASRIEFATAPLPKAIPNGAHLFHFDGTLMSTKGLQPLPGYVATLRPGEGKFGGAVAVEEGTTNLITQKGGSALYNPRPSWLSADAEVVYDPTCPVGNGYVAKLDATTNGTYEDLGSVLWTASDGLAGGDVFTLSFWAKWNKQIVSDNRLLYTDGTYTAFQEEWVINPPPDPNKWQYYVIQYTIPTPEAGKTIKDIALTPWLYAATDDTSIGYISPIMAERKPFATSFVDGTRAAGKLEYAVIPSGDFTIHLLASPDIPWDDLATVNSHPTESKTENLVTWGTPGTDGFLLRRFRGASPPVISLEVYAPTKPINHAYTWAGRAWATLDIVVSGNNVSYYVDGNVVGTQTFTRPASNVLRLYRPGYEAANFGLFDELLILPYAASEEEIRSWYEQAAPFFDPSPDIDTAAQPITVIPQQVWIDAEGLKMQPPGFTQPGMKLSGRMLGFWDINHLPAIGLGDVREMAQQLGSTMEYGLMIAQGEIRASSSVLQQSLIPLSVDADHIAPDSMLQDKYRDGSIYLPKLASSISVADIASPLVVWYDNPTDVTRSWSAGNTSEQVVYSVTLPRQVRDALIDSIEWRTTSGTIQITVLVTLGFYIDGVLKQSIVLDAGSSNQTFMGILDISAYSVDNHVFEVRLRPNSASSGTIACTLIHFQLRRNNLLPLRPSAPAFAVVAPYAPSCALPCESSCQAACQGTAQSCGSCQTSCQSTSQAGCGATCERTCQTPCQVSCQNTCETTSQGGGGCIRAGTPVTVWDPETQTLKEVPVEQLRPGMILPRYDPATDSITYGRLVELRDALYSTRFYRISTDVGPSIDVTQEQPFDVWWEDGPKGPGWYKLQARYLQPGMQMVRPFDAPERKIATITHVEIVREKPPDAPGVHFWWPIPERGEGLIVAGYSDLPVKLPL